MRNGVPIIDVDRHVMEPIGLWQERLPPSLRAFAPDVRPLHPGPETLAARMERLGEHALLPTPPVVTVQGKPLWRGLSEQGYIEVGLHAAERRQQLVLSEHAEGQIQTMDESGVDVAMLLPTYAGFLVFDEEFPTELSRAYASAYNEWLAEQCRRHPQRLKGAVLLSRHDPSKLVEDLEAGLRLGLSAAVMRPNPIHGRHLGAAELLDFYAACAANSVPLLLHEGTHTRTMTAGADRFASHFAQHACSHPMEMMMGLLALLEGGVLERFPTLRVAFLESGCGWLPYWLWRLDEMEFAQVSNELPGMVMRRPSEYFRRQCWIALEPGEAMLADCVRHIGPDRMVFGTDFPHVDHDHDILDGLFAKNPPLSATTLRAALWDNPRTLLGLPAEAVLE